MSDEPTDAPPIRFRPSKKRKVFRQRTHEDEQATDSPTPTPVATSTSSRAVASDYFPSAPADTQDDSSSAAVVIKARSGNPRNRLRGVNFGTSTRSESGNDVSNQQLVPRNEDAAVAVTGIADRFTHQTGLKNAVDDRHMNAYIEARLSNRITHGGKPTPDGHADDGTADAPTNQGPQAPEPQGPKGPTIMQGTLMEVDLSIASPPPRTADPSPRPSVPQALGAAAKKPRLGPDGKPWRSRKRRGSDDIKRDQLVEQFLHENRLDVYDVPSHTDTGGIAGGEADGDADERLAEQFRRQFEEDVAQRRQKKKKPTSQQTGKAGPSEDVLKGPKLGGSRNSRAAVRDMLLRKEKDGKR